MCDDISPLIIIIIFFNIRIKVSSSRKSLFKVFGCRWCGCVHYKSLGYSCCLGILTKWEFRCGKISLSRAHTCASCCCTSNIIERAPLFAVIFFFHFFYNTQCHTVTPFCLSMVYSIIALNCTRAFENKKRRDNAGAREAGEYIVMHKSVLLTPRCDTSI